MQADQTIGIDLPLKALVWGTSGSVWIAYNDPAWLAVRTGSVTTRRTLSTPWRASPSTPWSAPWRNSRRRRQATDPESRGRPHE